MSTIRVLETEPNGWVLVYFGERQEHELPVGILRAHTNATIVLTLHDGSYYTLSEEQAGQIANAFKRARLAAQEQRERMTGYSRPQVSRSANGALVVTYRGKAREMRRKRFRAGSRAAAYARCPWCHGSVTQFWVAKDGPDRCKSEYHEPHTEICEACVKAIEDAPKGIRAVTEIGSKQ